VGLDIGAQCTLSPDAPHQFKLSIWRRETDAPVYVVFAQLDALVELAIVQFYSSIDRLSLAGRTNEYHEQGREMVSALHGLVLTPWQGPACR
jgi:hypothetical protein